MDIDFLYMFDAIINFTFREYNLFRKSLSKGLLSTTFKWLCYVCIVSLLWADIAL
jgi:hypothetical protein